MNAPAPTAVPPQAGRTVVIGGVSYIHAPCCNCPECQELRYEPHPTHTPCPSCGNYWCRNRQCFNGLGF